MRQKKHNYTVMSDKVCNHKKCKRKIKLNVVDRKQEDKPLLCYSCYMKQKSADKTSS